jgi:peptidoglycan-N-acetylglucosamine deacetylase
MVGDRVKFWQCPQYFVGLAGLLLFLVSGYMVQQYVLGVPGHTPVPVIDTRSVPAAMHASQAVDCSTVPCLALTFDDGPNSLVTPQILSALEHANVRATFFVVGMRVPGNEAILQRMYTDGDEIGNHSWNHADLTKLTAEQVRDQFDRTQLAVMAAGLPAPRLFRPPYGAVNATVRSQIPIALALWNVDPEDWRTTNPNQISDRILAAARPGRVVDLHDIYAPTAQSLPIALEKLKSQYHLVTVSQLFNLSPGQRGEYFGR